MQLNRALAADSRSLMGATLVGLGVLLPLGLGAPQGTPAGRGVDGHPAGRPIFQRGATHIVVPQARAFHLHGQRDVRIEAVEARVLVREQVATTTLDVRLHNPGTRQAEAVLLLPVPPDSAVSGFAFQGASLEPTAQLLRHDEARRTYDSIVARLKDPALLEFAGYDLIRSSVFPVPAHGNQAVRITYEHLLSSVDSRVDYSMPRSDSLAARVPWTYRAEIISGAHIDAVYSPSHAMQMTRLGRGHVRFESDGPSDDPGEFCFSFLRGDGAGSGTFFAYPDAEAGGGYFLCVGGLPTPAHPRKQQRREVTLVLDRSGSMSGGKLEQARSAALQLIEGLAPGELFNVIDYSSQVASFASAPVARTDESIRQVREYLSRMLPRGGTNIHDALLAALRQERAEDALPIVLFLTDGLPTVGRTSEVDIRQLVERANPHRRRVYCMGLGDDVNAPLLDRLADATGAVTEYVRTGSDIELAVAGLAARLQGPIFSDVRWTALGEDGRPDPRIVREVEPVLLPDLFAGDQLVLLGQFTSERAFSLRFDGKYLGTPRSFVWSFSPTHASVRQAFVPRLWAARRIARLADEIRQAGAASPVLSDPFTDPRLAELANEILRLSTRFGVLSEYTAFLATEGERLERWDELVLHGQRVLEERAWKVRSGAAGVNQGRNFNVQKQIAWVDNRNAYLSAEDERVEAESLQQVGDRNFIRRGARWTDTQLVLPGAPSGTVAPTLVEYGSPRYQALLDQLITTGRQGSLSLRGEIELQHAGRRYLINNIVP